MEKQDKDPIAFSYKFIFNDGKEHEFKASLDPKNLDLLNPKKESDLEWTRLEHCKCSNCTLNSREHQYCPVAVNITDIIEFFKHSKSYEEAKVLVSTPERDYLKEITLQRGLSSLIGIYMVTTGCPIMVKLKPMVRFHLPFATIDETTYRMISMYLFAQYYLQRKGKKPDWHLKGLYKIYQDVQTVNKSFCERLLVVVKDDASINAVVILDAFANYISNYIDNTLERIEYLFKPYLD